MSSLKEVYSYVVELEDMLKKDLERAKDWQKRARERIDEDRKWGGYVDYGELESANKSFAEVNAQLNVVKLVKKKIEEEIIKE
jgi:hypothetical protein